MNLTVAVYDNRFIISPVEATSNTCKWIIFRRVFRNILKLSSQPIINS